VAEGFDIVLCDTSGRLHNNWALMDELAKCKRIVEKRLKGAPHEVRAGVHGVGESLRHAHSLAGMVFLQRQLQWPVATGQSAAQ
jgi:signal recognition particle GTPase